jgi:hypothetical protein
MVPVWFSARRFCGLQRGQGFQGRQNYLGYIAHARGHYRRGSLFNGDAPDDYRDWFQEHCPVGAHSQHFRAAGTQEPPRQCNRKHSKGDV